MSKKFSDLTQLTTPATDDILPIDDVSAGSTKKLTVSDLLNTANAIGASAVQLANDQALGALNSTATKKDLIKLGSDNYLRLSQLPVQNKTTNSTVENQLQQRGWDFIVGDGDSACRKTVTLPATYADANWDISISCLGFKSGSDPTGRSDFSTGDTFNITCHVLSSSQFEVSIYDPASVISGSTRVGYSWIAIGTKA